MHVEKIKRDLENVTESVKEALETEIDFFITHIASANVDHKRDFEKKKGELNKAVKLQPTQFLTNVRKAESIARASLQEGREAMQAMTAALIKIIRNRQEGKDAEKIAD